MEDHITSSCLPFLILKKLKSQLDAGPLRWHLPTSVASYRGLRAMPEETHSALHQGPMGEESPQLSSHLSSCDHVQGRVDLAPDCEGPACVEPPDTEDERPVSLVSTLSSGSSRDSHSLFGSTVALPSSTTPPIPSEEDIDLELSPAESPREQAGNQSPSMTGSRERWRDQLEPRAIGRQWNNNNATAARRTPTREGLHRPTLPVVTDAMAPNPKLTYVDRVVMEIIETERTYVRDLRSIVEDYLAHIIDTGNLPIRPEQVSALFGNIEDIYEFNSELLQSLDMCENDPVAIAQCFVNKSEYFEIYTQYCNNYPNSVATLTNCMRSKTLAKFFRDRQAALKRSLPLGSYLLKPVQRILKYHLLLQEIAKHLDPDEEGCEVIQEAIDTMTGVAWYINDMKRKHEHAVRVQEIQSLLINWKGPDLTTYGELVLEGTFHVLRAKNTRTLFLFEKMLLITKKRGELYVYKIHISCSTLMLLDSVKDPLLFSVIHFKRPKQPHTVQAKSVEEKRLWAHHIKRLILENHNTIVPQKATDTTVDNANYPGKYQYSPERMMKAQCCQADDFHHGGRNGRRRSEPAKQIMRSTKAVLKHFIYSLAVTTWLQHWHCNNNPHVYDFTLQHADSEGALLGDRCSLQPATSVSALTSILGEPQAQRPCVEDLIPRRDSLEQLSSTDNAPKLGSPPSEGGLEKAQEEDEEEGESYKEDILMGDDQVADFASSVLAAISCWHYRARALLSTHFTTDDQNREAVELNCAPTDRAEICRREESNRDVVVEETLSERVGMEELGLPVERSDPLEVEPPQCTEPPAAPSEPEEDTPETPDTSRETAEEEEGGSDSSGLHGRDTSGLTNGELSEEDMEVLSGNADLLPPSVLDQAGLIAEHPIGSLSRRSSLFSEDLGPLTADSGVFQSPPACIDAEKRTQITAAYSPEPAESSETDQSAGEVPALSEGERRSTLSKQDRLLIHKIRRYYEHAEHQDANFSIKRRESLSYIPAGLVRHLSRQLSSAPPEKAGPAHRKSPSRNRPTSWSVFDLPGLERSQSTEGSKAGDPHGAFEDPPRPQNATDAAPEEFRPASDMLEVWQVMETEEENQEAQEPAEELDSSSKWEIQPDARSEMSDVTPSQQPLEVSEDSDMSPAFDSSPMSSTTSSLSAEEGRLAPDATPCRNSAFPENERFHPSHLPKVISFQTSAEEEQILQDVGRMKNKVFQLARQYSQRIKNNRPLVWQRSRPPAGLDGPRKGPAGQEEKSRRRGHLRLPFSLGDQAVIHEVQSPSPVQPPSSEAGSVGTAGSPQSPQTESFLWPHVQELRSRYAPALRPPTAAPGGPEDACRGGWSPHRSSSSVELNGPPADGWGAQPEGPRTGRRPGGEARHLTHPLLCRWSSLDHMLGSLTVRQEQSLLEPPRDDGPPEDPNGSRPALRSSGKASEINLVKSLREKFQSLGTS
ncbi:pleckstrin homology domain-containing family G member 3-like [Menidia menidia]